jgi:hypothetical protein
VSGNLRHTISFGGMCRSTLRMCLFLICCFLVEPKPILFRVQRTFLPCVCLSRRRRQVRARRERTAPGCRTKTHHRLNLETFLDRETGPRTDSRKVGCDSEYRSGEIPPVQSRGKGALPSTVEVPLNGEIEGFAVVALILPRGKKPIRDECGKGSNKRFYHVTYC